MVYLDYVAAVGVGGEDGGGGGAEEEECGGDGDLPEGQSEGEAQHGCRRGCEGHEGEPQGQCAGGCAEHKGGQGDGEEQW